MCSCNSSKNKPASAKTWTHTYRDSSGQLVTKAHSEEMEARMAASSLGGTVKPS